MRSEQVVFLLASILTWQHVVSDEESSSSDYCRIPPQPNHGSYEFSHLSETKHKGHPNDFILDVTCEEGYKLIGERRVACLAGHWFEEMPVCLPSCKKPNPLVASYDFEEDEKTCTCVLEREIPEQLPAQIENTEDDDKDNPCGVWVVPILKIVAGGRVSENSELPWHAAIYTKTTKPYMQICGGTLVSINAVISAAHCFWSESLNKLKAVDEFAVALGKRYRPWNDSQDKDVQKFDVTEIKIPPRYQGSMTHYQDDIAIVKLSDDVLIHSELVPICLSFDPKFDDEQLTSGSLGKIGGWGLTSEDGQSSPVLMVAELPSIDIETCIAGLPISFKPSITSDKICAGHTNGTAVCKGDSGGGLVFKSKRRYYLRGIVSTAPTSDHLCNVYTWATFTHVQRHEHFIRQFVDFPEIK